MRPIALFLAAAMFASAQSDGPPKPDTPKADEEFLEVYTEHPRLLLRQQRLRLLRRERERRTMRWVQFETLMAAGADMPEPGFALALYYQISGDAEAGKKAIGWALGPDEDLRQIALVFDWCQPLLSPQRSRDLAAKIEKLMASEAPAARKGQVEALRNRAFGAVALAGHNQKLSNAALSDIVREWWRGSAVPAIHAHKDPIAPADYYALFELLHAVRDNTNTELRDDARAYFKALPLYHLLLYYPAAYPAPENEYRIPRMSEGGEPDLNRAIQARATELSMVAYDTNAPESQVLQGWLMNDRFLMRGTMGITYEFLWANPYQPGLSYYHVSLVFYDPEFGRLLVRSSWDEDATWFSLVDGNMQVFRNGAPSPLKPSDGEGQIEFPYALIFYRDKIQSLKLNLKEDQTAYLLNMGSGQKFDIEAEDRELSEVQADIGGILTLQFPPGRPIDIRLTPSPTHP